jgi:hypothetical protein
MAPARARKPSYCILRERRAFDPLNANKTNPARGRNFIDPPFASASNERTLASAFCDRRFERAFDES